MITCETIVIINRLKKTSEIRRNFLIEVRYASNEDPIMTTISAPKFSKAKEIARAMFRLCEVKVIKEVL